MLKRTPTWTATALVLAAVAAVAGLSGAGTPVRAASPPTSAPEGRPATIDDLFAEVARRVPAFGGMFLREGTLQVYLLDAAQATAAEEAIVAVFGRERLPEGKVQVLKATYSFGELKAWHDLHRLETLGIPGVIKTSIAESKNRLRIGVKDASVVPEVESQLVKQGVPLEAVEIVETAPVVEQQTLQSTVRPVLGGTRIQRSVGGGCTMSFTAVRQGQAGFVTNSHCTATQALVDGSIFNQALASGSTNRFGVETADAPAFPCLVGIVPRLCRSSDSAFVRRNSGSNAATLPASADFGYLALPAG